MAKVGIGYYGGRRKGNVKGPSEEDVAKAVKKFQENGGLIEKLPDELTPSNILVKPKNMRRASPYESVSELTTLFG